MDFVPLRDLGLSEKWPKLDSIQADLADFQRREQKASAEVSTLRAQLPQARARDLDAEAAAVRRGRKPPTPTHEPGVQRDLDRATRERDVLARTIQAVHEEIGAFMAEHQAAVYADVVEARHKVAEQLAEHARATLSHYARFEDLGQHCKRLRPVEPVVEGLPAARLTNSFAGMVHTTQTDAPPRGHVESVLAYLTSLGDGVVADTGGVDNAA